MTTKLSLLSQADAIVKAQIVQRRPPMFETLKAAYGQIGDLAETAKSFLGETSKGFREQNDGLPSEFDGGINQVIRNLSAFRSGYASNDPTQQVSAGVTKRASQAEFLAYLKTEIEKSATEEAPEALARLRAVAGVIKSAVAEVEALKDKGSVTKNADGTKTVHEGIAKDDGGITIPVFMDPMQVKTTSVEDAGAKTAAGSSSPSTAPSNFTQDPGAITTPPPSSAPNASTMSAVSTAGTGTGGQSGAPFSGEAPIFQPGATSGPAASTSAVNAVTGGATNSGPTSASFSPDEVAKAAAIAKAAADADLTKTLEDVRKAAEKSSTKLRQRNGWTQDLNTREFMSGERKIDFGADSSKA